MGLNFTNSWFGAVFNPVGYQLQHVSISKAADEYAAAHAPSAGIDLDSVTEVSFKEQRQQWIDACTGALKARDVGYSKANCASNCAGKFDQDNVNDSVQKAIAEHQAAEQAELKKP